MGEGGRLIALTLTRYHLHHPPWENGVDWDRREGSEGDGVVVYGSSVSEEVGVIAETRGCHLVDVRRNM